jgi:hypothetical protein
MAIPVGYLSINDEKKDTYLKGIQSADLSLYMPMTSF